MKTLRVAPIVEGHGEVNSIRLLLQRVWSELLGGEFIDVLQPIRQPRSKLLTTQQLERAVKLACDKLAAIPSKLGGELILLMVDADRDPACILGPRLLDQMRNIRPDVDVACVLPTLEYETWFAGSAESLERFLSIPSRIADDPEGERLAKGWIEARFKRVKYSETVDQPAMTAVMDLGLCRKRCRSFDKLCRELEKRLKSPAH